MGDRFEFSDGQLPGWDIKELFGFFKSVGWFAQKHVFDTAGAHCWHLDRQMK